MLTGRYETSMLRPMIDAHVSIPSINAAGFVTFLIDTGADCTTLTQADGSRLHINYSHLTKEDHAMGYSGSTSDYLCDGIVSFSEIGVVEYIYKIELRITKPDPDLPELFVIPSLLGRDIINRWKLSFDPFAKKIVADVVSFDQSNTLDFKS